MSAALPTLTAATAVLAKVSDANDSAVNTARDRAVNANGGLSVALPAVCLFETASGGGACPVINTPQGFLFRAAGGPSGWPVEGLAPTQQIQLQISLDGRPVLPDGRPVLPDGRTVLNVPNNGAPC